MPKNRKIKLDREEEEILRSVESGEWTSTRDSRKKIERFQRYAKAMVRKNQRVNIRLSSNDLIGIQKLAVREGIPYQTLMASILHKYAAGILRERLD